MLLQSIPGYADVIHLLKYEILPVAGPEHRGLQLWVTGLDALLNLPLLHGQVYSPQLASLFRDTSTKIVAFHITGDDEIDFYLGRHASTFTMKHGKAKSRDMLLKMPSDILFAVLKGKLNPDKAVIAGKIIYEGSHEHLGFVLHFLQILQDWYQGESWWQQAYRELVDVAGDLRPGG